MVYGGFLNPNGLISKIFSRNRARFKPLLRKIFHALCEMNMPVIVPMRPVMALKTSLFHDTKHSM